MKVARSSNLRQAPLRVAASVAEPVAEPVAVPVAVPVVAPVVPAARPFAPAPQRGAALIVSLLLLAIVMLIATAAWQIGTQEERMVGQARDRAIAFEAAEAALRDADNDLLGNCGTGIPDGTCTPRPGGINGETGFGNGGVANTCSNDGLCTGTLGERPDFSSANAIAVLSGTATVGLPVIYGKYTRPTGSTFNGPGGVALPWQPRYVIDVLCYTGNGQGMTATFTASCPAPIYRVTAMARGVRRSTTGDQPSEVILQSYVSLYGN